MKIKLRGKIVTPSRIIENGDVCAENGIITYVGAHRNDDALYETADYGDRYISPGFIDMHLHGGGGADSDEDEIFIHPAAADFCAFRRTVLPLNGQLPAAVRQIRPG